MPYCTITAAKTTATIDISLIRILRGRTGSVLERIAYRIADNSGLVGFTAFSAVRTALDVFLRIIPCAAGVGHHNRKHSP